MITVTLKDNIQKQYESALSIHEIAKSISARLAKECCAAYIDDILVDVRYVVQKDCTVKILTFEDEDGKKAFRHTASHILAHAVKNLFPDAKLAIGPSTKEGFYYDFDVSKAFNSQEISQIESEMKKIISSELPIEKFELSREDAINLLKSKNEPYKLELLEDIPSSEIISFYQQGDFIDLCAGPHILNTKYIKAIKLYSETGSSGAYWRGSEKNKMLSRIYGTAFTKSSILEKYLSDREEAIKRDHNKLGRELNFFTTSENIGQGLPLLMPKGAKVIQILQRFIEDEEEKRGYVFTKTPFMAKSDLYKLSGHWSHYKDGMFIIGDEKTDSEIFALRPMTCPFQFSIYNSEQHSYRDLPIRYSETSTLFRNESSGEMHGLIRVRQFTISEGHLVCLKDQLENEFKEVVNLIKYVLGVLGLTADVSYRFSKWDPLNKSKYEGDQETWEETQNIMRKLLQQLNIDFEEKEGEAAFYGPKLDIQYKNVYGKEDTIITVQIDFSLAKKFNMTYIDNYGNKQHPIILHRTSVGCYERTLAILIEKYAGALPVWLSPQQAIVLPVSDKFNNYSQDVVNKLIQSGIRASADHRSEKIGYKIRTASIEKIPYILVVGEKEQNNNQISVRSRKLGDEGCFNLPDFIIKIQNEINNKII